eukprot:gnl/MRDRNA2_/MRDRNA2_144989_c0_seq1.p1 gnl/MRDRNA2_/MRDRNA2_144989_c0~~gnl/MRDRNA2_/MRDRNA2_144989_c0_seq1.p1  ORF type:complete len:286 (+),score=40.71 gnl/MRDRNA2_/MRDRNA2_144989_c0_seq1:109-858(+)
MEDDRALGCTDECNDRNESHCSACGPCETSSKCWTCSFENNELSRALWCVAQLPTVVHVFDLFLGPGRGSTSLLLHGLTSGGTVKDWSVSGFEIVKENVEEAVEALTPLTPVSVWNGSHAGASAKITIVHGRVPTTRFETHVLKRLCKIKPDAIVVDSPKITITQELMLLERYCTPKMYLVVNANLPEHSAWIKDYLLQFNNWAEALSGVTRDPETLMDHGWWNTFGKDGAQVLAIRYWSVLVRQDDMV